MLIEASTRCLSLTVPAALSDPPDPLDCDATEAECDQGSCASLNLSFNVSLPRPPGTNAVVSLHMCDPGTMTCSSFTSGVQTDKSTRVQGCKDGCKLTVSPAQGGTWGDASSCRLVAHECGEC